MHRHTVILALLFITAAKPTAQAIVTVDGFELPNPDVLRGTFSPSIVNAQLSGLSANSAYGSFDAPTIGFTGWEKWSSGVFELQPPEYTGNSGALTATLDQGANGPGLSTTGSNPGLITVDEIDYYGRLTTGPYEFTVDAESDIFIGSLTLQIKHSPFLVEGVAVTAFLPTLNGVASEPVVKSGNLGNSTDAISINLTYNIYTYTWNNLSIDPNEAFTLEFSSGADGTGQGFSIDTIALTTSTTSVPEPSSAAILASGVAALGFVRRRSGMQIPCFDAP